MSTSRLQEYTARLLFGTLPHCQIKENCRPEWLQNPDGRCLELDFYLPELGIAIEVQGQQHYRYTPVFHKDFEDFLAQVKRDKIKKEICAIKGIKLVEVGDERDVDALVNCLYMEDSKFKPDPTISKPAKIPEKVIKKLRKRQLALLNIQSKLDIKNMSEQKRQVLLTQRDNLLKKLTK